MSGNHYQAYPGGSGYQQPQYGAAPPAHPHSGFSQHPPPSHSPYSQHPPAASSPFAQQPHQTGGYNRALPPPPPPQQHPAGGFHQAPPNQQSGYGYNPPPPGSYPNQSSHPGYGYGGHAPPPGQYPPQGPPGGYHQGGPPPPTQAGPGQIQAYKQILQSCIQENHIENFYPPNSPTLDMIANRAPALIDQVCGRWRLPKEVGNDLVKLGLYDIILYIDDSGSMQFEENGERIADLKLILQRVAYAATLFDADGINVRFMNSVPPHHLINGIKNDQQVEQLMSGIQFKGLTPMGTELKNKVIDGLVFAQKRQKPVLVITITDGQPAGEAQNAVFETIKGAVSRASSIRELGPGAIKFQFAQVGNDQKAREFLGKLDEDPMVGRLVDCTSNFENESEEMSRANPPVNLTPELWLVKLLLGAIDHSYDRKDEKSNAPPPGQYPPQGQYGQPGQYAPPGQYGGPPPQGQYGAPQQYGQPPPGGYHQGGPPPPQGYQQGGYGGAPYPGGRR